MSTPRVAINTAAAGRISLDAQGELLRAIELHAPMHSPHEGIAVIHEELIELRAHVYGDAGRTAEARTEAIQLAAMALRYVYDLIEAT